MRQPRAAGAIHLPCAAGAIHLRRAAAARLAAGETALALDLLERAADAAPDDAGAWHALGAALLAAGRSTEGLARLRRAAFLAPGMAEPQVALGLELLRLGRPALAAAHLEAAARLRPADWAVAQNLGLARQKSGAHEAAIAAFAEAERLAPLEADPPHALGTALHLAGRPGEAVAAYRRALALRPGWAEALSNLGCAQRAIGEPEAAIASQDAALAARPAYPEAHWNRALARLSLGRLAEAWEDHEWRWQVAGFPSAPRGFAQTLWQGEAFSGRTLLLHAEQGFGDTLMALRYVPLVAARGGTVLLETPHELHRLASALPGVARVLRRGDPLPAFDLHCPLLSLPRAFGTTLATIPAGTPYLRADPAAAEAWRARLAGVARPRVGLAWAGRPTHGNDANRSIRLATLAPLLRLPGIGFVSLQLGPAAAELAQLKAGAALDVGRQLADFADTAAVLANLDALVAVDTSVVHLAGALGVPTHVLLPFAPDWRWLLGRADTPWYPGMRLHRQAAPGDWSGPVASVAEAVGALAASRMKAA